MSITRKKTAARGAGGTPVSAPAAGEMAIPRTLNGNKTACSTIDKCIGNGRPLVCVTFNWGMALDWRFRPDRRTAFTGANSEAPAKERTQRQAGCERAEVGHQRLKGIECLRLHALDYTHRGAAA